MVTTFAVCTYNRSSRLPGLIRAMRAQQFGSDYQVLVVDNNSSDDTRAVVEVLAAAAGVPVRYVFESEQGIAPARNRAIREALDGAHLIFLDDDEIPEPGLLAAAVAALDEEGADCVGGRVRVVLPAGRPDWFSEDLFGFLAAVDYGDEPFWIVDRSTPVWTANIGYRVEIFRQDPALRFDTRYSRQGHAVGGGSDAVMFWQLLEKGHKLRYRPDMVVEHHVESWRVRRGYFVKLHYTGGVRYGRYRMSPAKSGWCGVPPYLVRQAAEQTGKALWQLLSHSPTAVRQAMNAAHSLGTIKGCVQRWRDGRGADLEGR